MKVFKKGFKPTVKFVIVFLAVALASYLLFKDVLKESFVDANYVIVGIKIEGALSAIYNSLTNTDASKGRIFSKGGIPYDILMKYPKEILGSIVDKYPDFKYSIIDTSADKVIYDPIAEYKSKKTMAPFPNTDNVGKYILYCNYYKVVPFDELKKISAVEKTRYEEEEKKFEAAKKPGTMGPGFSGEINPIYTIKPDTKTVCTTISDNIALTRVNKYTKATLDYGKSIKRNADGSADGDGDPALKANMNTLLKDTIDANILQLAVLAPGNEVISLFNNFNINLISIVYDDCAKNGFQNMEGFSNRYNRLYDETGNVVSSSAIVLEPHEEDPLESQEVEKKPAYKPAATSSNYTTPLIIAGVAIVGGGGMILLMRTLVG